MKDNIRIELEALISERAGLEAGNRGGDRYAVYGPEHFLENANRIRALASVSNGPDSDVIDEVRSHLGTALAQQAPSDDAIIMDHVRDAYRLLGGNPKNFSAQRKLMGIEKP